MVINYRDFGIRSRIPVFIFVLLFLIEKFMLDAEFNKRSYFFFKSPYYF